jgi:hypothetical protein
VAGEFKITAFEMFYLHFNMMNVYQISSIHYIFKDISVFLPYFILSSTELVKMSMYQIFNVHYIL